MGLLIAGFIMTTWLSAKIYRTGILMYGKKAGWKEMIKWMMKR
jgi:ABC-2 type transport system permease protein